MLVERQREKLEEAVLFFAKRVKKLGKTKLFKLLYFLDFEHYRDTGRSVTGMDYFAWKMGPVPVALYEEIKHSLAWESKVAFVETKTYHGHRMLTVQAIGDFDPSHFSKRELRIMEALATEYEDATAEEMVEATHLENLPWDQVYNKENNKQHQIPYELALRKQELDLMLASISERNSLVNALKVR